jgi:tol-pal system protein YbgF
MRYIRYIRLAAFVGATLLAPASAPAAASKEMQDLQRDVAQLQDQMTALQKTLDSKLGAIQAQLQQAVDTANKTNSNVTSLNAGVAQTLQSEMKNVRDQLNSVTGLSVKVDNTSNDISDLHNAVAGLVTTVNKQQLMLNDILNQVKLIQAPAAPPPSGDTGTGMPGVGGPPPNGQTLFNNAVRDQNSGKSELALPEWAEFLRLYPNDPNAASAQYNIGEIHYNQGKPDDAVKDFDAVIEQYGTDSAKAPTALYMKGMALKKAKRPTEAIATFRAVIKQFPGSDEAAQAKTQLTSMGVTAAAPARRGGR